MPEAASLIAQGVTDESLAKAFSAVIDAHQSPGTKSLSIDLVGFESHEQTIDNGEYPTTQTVTTPAAPTRFSASVTVDANGAINGKPLAADAARAADLKPYPDGDPNAHVVSQFTVSGDPSNLASLLAAHGDQPALDRQAAIDTVLAVVPEAKSLIDGGVTDESLAKAFAQIIDARGKPGEQTLSLSLVGFKTETQQVGWGDNTSFADVKVPADPTTFTPHVTVGTDGTVNGAKLPADVATQITSASRGVNQEFKDATLKEVGLSDEWLTNASQAQKDYALARIIDAKSTPGQKSFDFSFPYSTTVSGGEDVQTITTTAAGHIAFTAGADGTVNGKPLTAELAYAATKAVEAMPNAVRRATLETLGFKPDAIAKGSADQIKYALEKASIATATPGTTQFEVHMGGDKYAVGLKVGDDHKILGSGVALIPPPPKKSWWKTVVSVVCTVVSICYPPAAIICQGIQGAIAISSGAKGLGLIAAVAGAAAGVADIAGAASMANTLSTAASTISAANSAINAFQHGDFLGALSSAVSAGGSSLNGLGELGQTLSDVGKVAGVVSNVQRAIQSDDPLALIAAGAGAATTVGKVAGIDIPSEVATIGTIANTASAFQQGDYTAALNGVATLAGQAGFSTSSTSSGTNSQYSLSGTGVRLGDGGNSTVRLGGTGGTDATDDTSTLANSGLTTVDAVSSTVGGLLTGDPWGALDGFNTLLGSTLTTSTETEASGPKTTDAAHDLRVLDNATLPQYIVKPGDSLSTIAQNTLGDARRWPEIYAYNAMKGSPNQLGAGTLLDLPPADYELTSFQKNLLFNTAYIPPPVPQTTVASNDPFNIPLTGVVDLGTGSGGSVLSGPSFADGARPTGNITTPRQQEWVDTTPPIAKLFSAIDSWKRVAGGALSDAGGLIKDAFTKPDLTMDQRLEMLGDAKDSLKTAVRDGVVLPAMNLSGVTAGVIALTGIDPNRTGYIDLNTGQEASAAVSDGERLISTLEAVVIFAPTARAGIRGLLAGGADSVVGRAAGTGAADGAAASLGEAAVGSQASATTASISAAEYQRLAGAAGEARVPWLIREGEGTMPSTAQVSRIGQPMELDPAVSNTYMYVVKEDGSIVYAPQKMVSGRETVKHTDLAENGAARVSGEIRYDANSGQWVMDAQSGRYSAQPLFPGNPRSPAVAFRTQENLDAAVELARRSGTSAKIVPAPEP